MSLAINLAPHSSSAHHFETNSGISAFLHISPNDYPAAGQPAQLHITFSDRADVFTLQDCACRVELKQNEKVKATYPIKPLLAGATRTSTVNVIFPVAGAYDVSLEGTSLVGGFKPFHLEYPVKISGTANAVSKKPNKSGYFILVAAPIIILLAIITAYKRKK